jgi:hypothetical protein
MGAMITIRYDTGKVTDDEAIMLAKATQVIVAEILEVKDVFVYADKALIVASADPIETFVQVNAQKTPDPAALLQDIIEKLADWKQQHNFAHPINLNVIPVEWHAKFGV